MTTNNNIDVQNSPITFQAIAGGTARTSQAAYGTLVAFGNEITYSGPGTTGQLLTSTGDTNFATWATTGTGSGVVLQVVSTTKTSTFTTTSSTFTDITGLSVSITPASSSNKILVFCHVFGANQNAPGFIQLVRGSTPICIGDSNGSNVRSTSGTCQDSSAPSQVSCASMVYLDSPATTSSTTYKVQATIAAGSGTFYINEATTTLGVSDYTFASTITVWEVA